MSSFSHRFRIEWWDALERSRRRTTSTDKHVREERQGDTVKKSTGKLRLNRDTLRNLSATALHEAVGGGTISVAPTVLCSGRYTCALNCTVGCPTLGDCTDITC